MTAILKSFLKTLDIYLKRTDINEIIISSPNEVILDLGGEKWEFVKDKNITFAFLSDFPKALATYNDQQFNEKHIYLSSVVPFTKNRVGVVHNSLVISDTNSNVINIRVQKEDKFSLTDFIKDIPPKYQNKNVELFKENDSFEVKIKAIMDNQSNILISGGTGSGKTSLFNALLELINIDHRIVTLEDSAELNPPHKNITQLIVSKNGSSLSGVTYKDMIDYCMRLRPTNLLLGELDTRNTEAFLRLANTGHDGMIATLHADSTKDSIQALIMNLSYAGASLSLDGMYNYFESAIDYIIQIYKHQIVEVVSIKDILKTLREDKNFIKKINYIKKLYSFCKYRNWKISIIPNDTNTKLTIYSKTIEKKEIIYEDNNFKSNNKFIKKLLKNLKQLINKELKDDINTN